MGPSYTERLRRARFDLKKYSFVCSSIITTDISAFAVGAILSQGEISSDWPIAFASKCEDARGAFLDSEIYYTTIKQ